jgi:hypothetical protein
MDQPSQPSRPQPQVVPASQSRESVVEDIRAKQKRGEFTPFAGPSLGSNDTLARRTLLGGPR